MPGLLKMQISGLGSDGIGLGVAQESAFSASMIQVQAASFLCTGPVCHCSLLMDVHTREGLLVEISGQGEGVILELKGLCPLAIV
jgi:hypothetical protein